MVRLLHLRPADGNAAVAAVPGAAERSNPGLAQILSFALIGISFLFRPLGAVVAGHLGDRLGRKAMLVFTLIMMGAATALIGMLPTYAQIGSGPDPADPPPRHPGLLRRR